MTTAQLECFLEVFNTLNFTAAAENLFLSQPTVTRQIRLLEEELGVMLFTRSTKDVKPTAAGEHFYWDAKEILGRMLSAKSKLADQSANFTTEISIGYTGIRLEEKFLPAVISAFSQKHPDVFITLKKLDFYTIDYNLRDDRVNMIYTSMRDAVHSPNNVFLPLTKGSYCAVMQKHHPLAKRRTLKLQDLKEEVLIIPEIKNCPKGISTIFRIITTELPATRFRYSDSLNTTLMLVRSGIGIAIVSSFNIPRTGDIAVRKLRTGHLVDYGIAFKKESPVRDYIEEIAQLSARSLAKTK